MNESFGNVEMAAVVVALVAALRDKFPKIDGFLVLLVSMATGVGLSYLAGGTDHRTIITRGILVAMAASGAMKALAYHAEKSQPIPTELEPAKWHVGVLDTREDERGFARAGVLLWTAAIGLIAMAGLLVLFGMQGCAAAKAGTCPTIHLLGELCPTVMVEWSDKQGVQHREAVKREELVLLGRRAEMVRRMGPDAGAP